MKSWTSILLMAGVLVGCSGSQTTVSTGKSEAARGKNACELMTLADANEVYGVAMEPSDRNRAFTGPSADVSTCSYSSKGAPMVVVTLTATWSKSKSSPLADRDAFYDRLTKDAQNLGPDVAKGMAAEKTESQALPALWQPALHQLTVFQGGVMLAIVADPAAGKNDRTTAEALIAKAVARL